MTITLPKHNGIIRMGLVVVVLSTAQLRAQPSRGIALVIGNQAYSVPLRTTINDAEQFSKLLSRFGFSVDLKTNLTLTELETAVRSFAARSRAAKTPTIFFFAGHGIQVNGTNYLIPIDLDLKRPLAPSDLVDKALSIDKVFDAVRSAGAAPKLVILDACRDNPFAQTSPNDWIPGLAAPTNAPPNTLIAFATDPGNVAAEGLGIHSPFTSSLLRAMKNPGIPADEVFRRVREDLAVTMGGGQTPWLNTSLATIFHFEEPVYLRTQITDGDDEVVVSVNGREEASWNSDGATERVSQLRGGKNSVEIKVFNQRSYTGGFPPFGHVAEGWRFGVAFSDNKGALLLRVEGAEDTPQDNGPRHGRLFTAARFDIDVNVETGSVLPANVDRDYWKHPTRGTVNCEPSTHPFSRGHCAVQQCPRGQWSRGTVGLTSDGIIIVSQQLETDLTDYGLCGYVTFSLLSREGQSLATGKTPSRCIPGKRPGPARISDLPIERLILPAEYLASVKSIQVAASCAADNFAPFGLGGRDDEVGQSSLELVHRD